MTETTPQLRLRDKVLVFGGSHGNLQATRRLLEEAAKLRVAPNHIICSGDAVAYCAAPQASVDLLREARVFAIMGNREESLAAEDCDCGFDERSLCGLLSRQWYDYCRKRLDRAAKDWMAGLPRQALLEIGGRRLLLVQGAPGAVSRFVFASTPWSEKAAAIAAADVDGIIGGHAGLPFAPLAEDRLWLNSGALGMPANDGTPRGWFALLEAAPKGLTITLQALAYDHEAAAAEMAKRGLRTGYADCLTTGLWPSLDVLPREERSASGQALKEQRLFWPHRRSLA